MSKSQFELSLVRPGNLSIDGQDSSVRYDEDRIKLLKVVLVEKVKGKIDQLMTVTFYTCRNKTSDAKTENTW